MIKIKKVVEMAYNSMLISEYSDTQLRISLWDGSGELWFWIIEKPTEFKEVVINHLNGTMTGEIINS